MVVAGAGMETDQKRVQGYLSGVMNMLFCLNRNVGLKGISICQNSPNYALNIVFFGVKKK